MIDAGGPTRSLTSVLATALTYVRTDADREAADNPPYLLPAALRPARERVAAELDHRRVEALAETPVVTRVLAPAQTVPTATRFLLGDDDIDFPDAACVLLAAGALTLDEARTLVPLVRGSRPTGLQRQIVVSCLTTGDLQQAHLEAEALAPQAWIGYRDIARWHARRAESTQALALWPKLASGKERHHMRTLRSELVQHVARVRGWRAALELTSDRRVGASFRTDALRGVAKTGDVELLTAILDDQAAADLDELDKLLLLVTAVVADSPRSPQLDHPRVGELVDRLVAVDPTIDRETMRTRDSLLSQLWPALGSPETLARVRRAVRTPGLRRELMVLPRDC